MRPHGRADVEAAGGRGCVALIHSLLRSLEVCPFCDVHSTGWFLCHDALRCFHNIVLVHKQMRCALLMHSHAQIDISDYGCRQTDGCWLYVPNPGIARKGYAPKERDMS